jgi:glycosyltransferase involved in cell wall biosynthesis
MNASVLIIQEHMPAFRVPFYERLRELLAERDISLRLIFAPNQRNTFLKRDLDWAKPVAIKWYGSLAWQPVLGHCQGEALVIVQQEMKYLANPVLQLWRGFGGPKVAYWGHGKNFQKPPANGPGASIKKFLSKRVDWWFAYNDLSARIVEELGFPSERITSVGNAVDTAGMIQRRKEITEDELATIRTRLGLKSDHIAVFTGGLYRNKRLPFLLEAARLIREKIPDFHLLVIGEGSDRPMVAAAAAKAPWIHDLGPMTDSEKVPYWAVSRLLLMPGLVGLVVVDSFALGVPLITTDYPYHSPEIDYLKSGHNGLIVNCGESAGGYAEEVAGLFRSPARLASLSEGALASSSLHSIEIMASSFADGITKALAAPRLQPSNQSIS